VELEHLKIKTRLKNEKFASVKGECFVYYESIKREPKIRGIYECRCDERLQTKTKKFTRLTYTGLVLELEHLKISVISGRVVCNTAKKRRRRGAVETTVTTTVPRPRKPFDTHLQKSATPSLLTTLSQRSSRPNRLRKNLTASFSLYHGMVAADVLS
jgi:hypothetical protein